MKANKTEIGKPEATQKGAEGVIDDLVNFLLAGSPDKDEPAAKSFARGLAGLYRLDEKDAAPAYQAAALAMGKIADRAPGSNSSYVARMLADHYAQKGGVSPPKQPYAGQQQPAYGQGQKSP